MAGGSLVIPIGAKVRCIGWPGWFGLIGTVVATYEGYGYVVNIPLEEWAHGTHHS